jgi:ribosomal protein L15
MSNMDAATTAAIDGKPSDTIEVDLTGDDNENGVVVADPAVAGAVDEDEIVITLNVGGGRYGGEIIYPQATITRTYAGNGTVEITFTGTSYDGTETFNDDETKPTKPGIYTVTAKLVGDDDAQVAEQTGEFEIERAQYTKPEDVDETQSYSSDDFNVSVANEDGEKLLTISIIDTDNYEWSDKTNDAIIFNLSDANSYHQQTETKLIWTIIALTVVLIALLIMANIYWLARDKKNEKRQNSRKSYSFAGGLTLLAAAPPVWQVVVVIVLAAAIAMVTAYNAYYLTRKPKGGEDEEDGVKQNAASGNGLNINVSRKAEVIDCERVSADEQIAPAKYDEEEDDIKPMMYVHETQRVKEETTPEETKQTKIEDIKIEDDFTDEWEAYEQSLMDNADFDDDTPDELVWAEGAVLPDDSADDDDMIAEPVLVTADAVDAEEHLSVTDDNGEVAEVLQKVDKKAGEAYVTRYRKSFTARLIQSRDESKEYYSNLKNDVLSYAGTSSEVSWNYDCITVDGKAVIKFDVRGKTLNVYYDLVPEEYENSKYHVERSLIKKCADVPCRYRIKSPRREKFAMELIAEVLAKYNLVRGRTRRKDYILPYAPTPVLVERGLAKEYLAKEKYADFVHKREVTVEKAKEKEIKKRQNREVVNDRHREEVKAEEVDEIINDDIAQSLVEDIRSGKLYEGKKGIVNIDSISEHFERGECVTIETLKEKGIIPQNVGYVKVLARGMLTKPLTIDAQDFSVKAVKMILLTGGTARRV